jgi:hypothetical protein
MALQLSAINGVFRAIWILSYHNGSVAIRSRSGESEHVNSFPREFYRVGQ